ncbi:MAG: antitoxin Xre-like helix-turn-helix domain-containing protein, partial [Gemmatimonadota bacterium]
MRPETEKAPVDLVVHAPAALRTVFSIADSWELSSKETRILLGSPPESTFYKWKSGKVGVVSRDLLERVSYLLGIYKALQLLLP